jgi:hypothetical protein
MKNKFTFHYLVSLIALSGFILFTGNSFAQQKPEAQAPVKKTITIHVTQNTDGKTIVTDTTIVTDGNFDADAFLKEKGVTNAIPSDGKPVEKRIIIQNPGSKEITLTESDGNSPDSVVFEGDHVIVINDKFDNPLPPAHHPGMNSYMYFNTPDGMPPMQGPQFDHMMEGMARSLGLENVMPFGEMKQVVVKKKRNGKKVIITFEDRNPENVNPKSSNQTEKRVIMYKNDNQGMAPGNIEGTKVEGQPGETIIIHRNVAKTENGDQVIINAEVEQAAPPKEGQKVIIIKEEKIK